MILLTNMERHSQHIDLCYHYLLQYFSTPIVITKLQFLSHIYWSLSNPEYLYHYLQGQRYVVFNKLHITTQYALEHEEEIINQLSDYYDILKQQPEQLYIQNEIFDYILSLCIVFQELPSSIQTSLYTSLSDFIEKLLYHSKSIVEHNHTNTSTGTKHQHGNNSSSISSSSNHMMIQL